jgi:23S rRNA pseudouridine1911/1915/1917 synthase
LSYLHVLCNKNGLILVYKPAGVCSDFHLEDKVKSIEAIAKELFPKYRLANRIDKNTSGILVLADTSNDFHDGVSTYHWLINNWHGKVHKSYLAIMPTPNWDREICKTSLKDKPTDSKFLPCETQFEVMQCNKYGLALVECTLLDGGRTHQIRKHAQKVGFPITGDWRYGGTRHSARPEQLLHAWKIAFDFPTGRVEFQAPLPKDFRSFEFEWDSVDRGANKVWTIEQ